MVLLSSGLISGCLGVKPATPTRFYVLNPAGYDETLLKAVGKADAVAVEIIPVRLPQYLEKPQIVTRTSDHQLKLAEYHQWGGNLKKNINRVLAQNMALLLHTSHVAISPYRSPLASRFRVEIEVMRFEKDADGIVRLGALWRIYQGHEKKVLSTRFSRLESPDGHNPQAYEQTVSAMGELLGELSRIIAKAIIDHLPKEPL